MALDNVTSHFSTMLEPIASASFLSSLSIIHGSALGLLFLNLTQIIYILLICVTIANTDCDLNDWQPEVN